MHHLLNLLIWLPILGGGLVLWTGDDNRPNFSRVLALFFVVLTLILSTFLWLGFDFNTTSMQWLDVVDWLPAFGIQYALGIDGLSLVLIVLSIFTNLVVVLATWTSIRRRVAPYMASFLIMQGLLVGVFASLDALVFYIFFRKIFV